MKKIKHFNRKIHIGDDVYTYKVFKSKWVKIKNPEGETIYNGYAPKYDHIYSDNQDEYYPDTLALKPSRVKELIQTLI